jgi:hypothetical protein
VNGGGWWHCEAVGRPGMCGLLRGGGFSEMSGDADRWTAHHEEEDDVGRMLPLSLDRSRDSGSFQDGASQADGLYCALEKR